MKGILYLQSSYSMLENMISLEDLFLACSKNKYEFIALTDTHLHGTHDLFKYAKKYNIKPILGMKIKVTEPNETNFLLYVKNQEGYTNLLKLSSIVNNNVGLSINDLIKYQRGLVVVTSGFDSIIDQTIAYGNEDAVSEIIKTFNNSFTDFYIGLQLNYEIQINSLSSKIINIANNQNVKMLPIHQSSYFNDDDFEAYEVLLKIANENNVVKENASFKFLSLEEINFIYGKHQFLKENLNNMIKEVVFEYKYPKFDLPNFNDNLKVSNKEYLKSLSIVGLKRRLEISGIKDDKVYISRLEYELDVICKMNFENYFLVVYDFIRYAKTNNILVGPGRGSAAGSLVAYCLGITNVDPIKYGLMFERFLNPARVSMPDIDIDFPDNKREQVINYVKDKYGVNHICSITTFSTLGLRSSVRDVARVMKLPPERAEGIINSVIRGEIDSSDILANKLLTISNRISGLYRQTGTHAAGIILSYKDLTKYIPMQKGAYSFNQAQYNASNLEELGLNKIDFLGLKNLSIISEIVEALKKNNINVDLNSIDFNDKKTFELLSKGDTTGIFQLESDGMRNVLKKLKPNNFEDIVATLALYRPGPMENIDVYISRKNGEKFKYLHESLKEILQSTFGIIIYQEQIMQIAQVFAGYNLFDADMLRVGVSKKDHKILNDERKKFTLGATKKGHNEKIANDIYDYIVKFADYGFNRSHSVSYSVVAYQMAYLKANYYETFMRVLLTSVIGNESQTDSYIKEVLSNGVKVYSPRLDTSSNNYEIFNNGILMPFNTIKGFGSKTVKELLELENRKEVKSLNEVKELVKDVINDSQFKNLIYSGALDFIGHNRKTLIMNSDLKSIGYEKYIKDFKITEVEDYSFSENALYEKQAIGVNIVYDLSVIIDEKNPNPNKYLKVSNINKKDNILYLIGFVSEIKEYINKNNELMYFMKITDGLLDFDVTVFTNTISEHKEKFNESLCIFQVRKNSYNNKTSYILQNIANI